MLAISFHKTYTLKDKHGRSVKYGSVQSKWINSASVSSYIHIHSTSCTAKQDVSFGQIEFIFSHEFIGNKHTLAYVHWYDGFTIDRESGLEYLDLTSSSPSLDRVVSLKRSIKTTHSCCWWNSSRQTLDFELSSPTITTPFTKVLIMDYKLLVTWLLFIISGTDVKKSRVSCAIIIIFHWNIAPEVVLHKRYNKPVKVPITLVHYGKVLHAGVVSRASRSCYIS